ncbi:MAG: hypothetical protein ACF8GE_09000 [Phycisphaerales bacterium JB043]
MIEVLPRVSRVDAIAGRTLVLPVRVRVGRESDPEGFVGDAVGITIGSEIDLVGRLYRMRSASAGESAGLSWIGPGLWWEVQSGDGVLWSEVSREQPDGASVWVVVVDLPAGAHAQPMRIGGERVNVRWHRAWSAPRRDVFSTGVIEHSSWIVRSLRSVAMSPTERWRVRLLNDRRARGVAELSGLLSAPLGHSVLEHLDRQMTDRWRLALGTLGEDDPELADRVREMLTRVVYLDGAPIPAWHDDAGVTSALLEALLGAPDGEQRVSVARGWLSRQARSVVWIDEDFVAVPDNERIVSLGLANLDSSPERVELVGGQAQTGSGIELGPFEASVHRLALGRDQTPQIVRADMREPVEGLLEPRHVAPPGGRLGPLVHEWSMSTWLEQRMEATTVEWMSAGLLYLEADGETLRMYVECRVPVDFFMTSSEEDIVRLWFGARSAPNGVMRISSRGVVHDELTGSDLSEASRVRRDRDRWSALVPVPISYLDASGMLLVGMERVDASGRRSTWPRPVFPWEIEPGRALFVLDGWHAR